MRPHLLPLLSLLALVAGCGRHDCQPELVKIGGNGYAQCVVCTTSRGTFTDNSIAVTCEWSAYSKPADGGSLR